MKLSRDNWVIKKLGQPEHWCTLLWKGVWISTTVITGGALLVWYLYAMVAGNWELIKHLAGAETETGWVVAGATLDLSTAYLIIMFGTIYRGKVSDWILERCPKIEYDD